MYKQSDIYGVYFMRGAFYLDVKELNGDLIATPIHSKGCKKLEVIGGAYKDIKALLKSEQGEIAQNYIDNIDFDFIIVGNGESCSYYINSKKGLVLCNATYMEEV
jgi:hypothetical protein